MSDQDFGAGLDKTAYKGGGGGKKKKPKRKKRILRSLKVNEISGVDKAAQVPAEAVLMKREAEITDVETAKGFGFDRPALLTAADGHTHLIDLADGQGAETTWNHAEGADHGHTHPWVMRLDGSIEIGEADGHTHSVSEDPNTSDIDKSAGVSGGDGQTTDGEPDMTKQSDEPTVTTDETVQKSIADLTSRAERAEAILKLDTDTRTYFDGLSEDAREGFLAKSDSERATEIAEASQADTIVYKSASGEVFRASDDQRLVEMAKRADAQAEEVRKANERVEKAELAKRAETELSNAPGTVEVRGQILKALTGVPGAEEFIKAANSALEGAFTTEGSSDGTVLKAEDQLEVLAKKYAEDHACSIEKARAEVLTTPEGSELYAQLEA